jgi:tetratricopeptide (TPR) repeat protein
MAGALPWNAGLMGKECPLFLHPEVSRMSTSEQTGLLEGLRVGFVGKLGGLNRREVQQLVIRQGGSVAPDGFLDSGEVDVVIIGAEIWPPADPSDLLGPVIELAVGEGRVEVITETELWHRLGLVENEEHVRRLYTPAMLAELLEVPIAVIRRWHRRGLILPVREVHRLPYFDFQEVAAARRLAELLAAGASPRDIERRLDELARYVPGVRRPLAQLSVIVEGRRILLRQGEGLVEPGGQLRFDFDALDDIGQQKETVDFREPALPPDDLAVEAEEELPATIPFQMVDRALLAMTPDEMRAEAVSLEEQGELERAMEAYRSLLAAMGPHAGVCFQLAELLYRVGEYDAARERYYMAIEIDDDFVEARSNLGCLLADTGETELAIASFQGALRHHPDYPDAHYHLARLLEEARRGEEASEHWRAFLLLAPESPWAEEAAVHVSEGWQSTERGSP